MTTDDLFPRGKTIRSRPVATKVLDIVMQLPTDFDWVDCSEDFTDDQAKAILELLDRPILALRRLRASLSARGNGYTCDNCGDVFQAARSDARFCSSACRQAEYRKNRATWGSLGRLTRD